MAIFESKNRFLRNDAKQGHFNGMNNFFCIDILFTETSHQSLFQLLTFFKFGIDSIHLVQKKIVLEKIPCRQIFFYLSLLTICFAKIGTPL